MTNDFEMTVVSPQQGIAGWEYKEIYALKKFIDICYQFLEEFSKNTENNNTSMKMGRLLILITQFVKKYPMMPQYLRNPEKILVQGKLATDMIHDQVALQYVLDCLTSAMTIDKRKGVPPDYYINKLKEKKEL